jgi:hypothetical protein
MGVNRHVQVNKPEEAGDGKDLEGLDSHASGSDAEDGEPSSSGAADEVTLDPQFAACRGIV